MYVVEEFVNMFSVYGKSNVLLCLFSTVEVNWLCICRMRIQIFRFMWKIRYWSRRVIIWYIICIEYVLRNLLEFVSNFLRHKKINLDDLSFLISTDKNFIMPEFFFISIFNNYSKITTFFIYSNKKVINNEIYV